ncbi:RNA polymerase sigma factor [Anaerophilus nitritogenes]|uniref:RNA polymerase sigma factor n=1 Tax=Anaerophilus nitritogenes TaxID=2498136 RepID=UPI001FA99560|nr:sigma-70 family RNA polymerase sigma factor [Anaerophilus nitritogenes]
MQEKSLIHKSQQGHIESFENLIKNYQKLAFNIAYRMLGNIEDAKDATQDAFLKAYKNIDQFKEESTFSTWLYKIVTNTCLDVLRKKKKIKIYSYDQNIETEKGKVLREIADEENTPEKIVEKNEIQKHMQQAIDSLSEHHRSVIILRDIQGFSYEEIAKILNCSKGTVKSRINRARQALKKIIKSGELFDKDYVKI